MCCLMDPSQQYLDGFETASQHPQHHLNYVLGDHQVVDLFHQQQQQQHTDSSSQSSPGIDFAVMESTGNEEELEYLIHGGRGDATAFDQYIFEGQQLASFAAAPLLESATVLGDHELPGLNELIHVSSADCGSHSSPEDHFAKAMHTSASSATSSSSDATDFYKASSEATSVMQQEPAQQQHWAQFPSVGLAGSASFAADSKGIFSDSCAAASPRQQDPQPPQPQQQQRQQQQQGGMATMRETLYRMAIWRPITATDCLGGSKPKRRNVRISSDPQTVAARHRRERISTKIRILQRLVPGGTKMDTASMLDEAIHYVKYLKSQVHAMEMLEQSSSESLLRNPSSAAASSSASTTTTASTSATAAAAGGICHLYNPHSGSGLLNGSIFWPQQFSIDSSAAGAGGLVVQPVNISGY